LGGFSKKLGAHTNCVVELWDVLEGLSHARRIGVTEVEVHVDSLVSKWSNSD
jgi:ribonuclease HI